MFLRDVLTCWGKEFRLYFQSRIVYLLLFVYAAIATGKFLAAWSIAGIMLVSSAGFWLIVGVMVPLDNGWIAANYLFTFLMAGSLCAVSAAVSAFCYNVLAAFLSSLAVCIVLAAARFSSWAEKFMPDNLLIMQLSKAFDFGQQYNDLISGQARFAAVAYFVLVIGAALWVNIIAVEYKRS